MTDRISVRDIVVDIINQWETLTKFILIVIMIIYLLVVKILFVQVVQ